MKKSENGSNAVGLSVVVPCYNEKSTIRVIVQKIKESGLDDLEIIIVDDFSTDGTREILEKEIEPLVSKVVLHSKNQGKGAALRTGFVHCTKDIVVVQDADLEYDPAEYRILMQPILDGRADVVFGSRFLGGRPHRVHLFWHLMGNRFLTLFSNMFTNLNLTDMETCYKMFKRDIIQKISIKEDRFGFEPEITAKIARTESVIYEVGISYYGRGYDDGKKIGWKDGFRAIYAIIKYGIFSK
jgi:glycosyltransferase involved in cell wall biosynthesis